MFWYIPVCFVSVSVFGEFIVDEDQRVDQFVPLCNVLPVSHSSVSSSTPVVFSNSYITLAKYLEQEGIANLLFSITSKFIEH